MLQVQELPYLREGVTPTGANYWIKQSVGTKNSGHLITKYQAAKTLTRNINVTSRQKSAVTGG